MNSGLPSRNRTHETPSLAVVDRVAEREGVDPVDLTPPLHSAVDPEALDSLFDDRTGGTGGRNGQVTFDYCGYEVRLRSDGAVSLEEL